MALLLSFINLMPRIFLGFCITHLLWNSKSKEHLLIKVFLAGLIGFGFSSLLAFFWLWTSLPLWQYVFFENMITVILTTWIYYKEQASLKGKLKSFSSIKIQTSWLLLLLTGTLLFIANLLIVGYKYPHGRMDAWTNWNVVARFIYLGGPQWTNTFLRQLDHPDYPLFISITNAISWTMSQKNTFYGPIALHFFLTLCTAGLFFSLLHTIKGKEQAILGTILFMAQPITSSIGMNQYADFPLASMILAIGGLTILYVETQEKEIAILVGFLTGLAAWTKNEGVVIVISSIFIWSIISLKTDRKILKEFIRGLLFPVGTVILFKLFFAPSNDIFSDNPTAAIIEKITDIKRYVFILSQAGIWFWQRSEGLLSATGLLVVYSLIVGKAKAISKGIWPPIILVSVQLAVYFAIYMVTPRDLAWHIRTSLDRLFFHIIPLTLLLVLIYIKSPQEFSLKGEILYASNH